jgi:hypothetical protein
LEAVQEAVGQDYVIRSRQKANDVQVVGHKCQQMEGCNKVFDDRIGAAVFQTIAAHLRSGWGDEPT